MKKTMHAIRLPKHVVLSKSEGPLKWLAPCGTDVHRVARTIDACILEQESYKQTKMIMRNGVLRTQKMKNLGAISVCLLEQLRLRAWIFVTYYTIPSQQQHFIFKTLQESALSSMPQTLHQMYLYVFVTMLAFCTWHPNLEQSSGCRLGADIL
jgi:hypothetical protein